MRLATIFSHSFFDGLTFGGFFTPSRLPDAPDRVFAPEPVHEESDGVKWTETRGGVNVFVPLHQAQTAIVTILEPIESSFAVEQKRKIQVKRQGSAPTVLREAERSGLG